MTTLICRKCDNPFMPQFSTSSDFCARCLDIIERVREAKEARDVYFRNEWQPVTNPGEIASLDSMFSPERLRAQEPEDSGWGDCPDNREGY